MKKFCYLGLAALLLPALVACGGGRPSGNEIKWEDGNLMAVAFLGYYDSFGTFETSPSYVSLTKTFPQIVEAEQVVAGLGRELYLVVPRDPMATLAVDSEGEYVTDDNREVFYRSEEGKPVLVLNNWHGENSLVSCTDNEGRSTLYSPGITPDTGALKVPADGSVLDISLPMPKPLKGFTSFDYGKDSEGNDFGIRVSLRAGQPVLTSSAAPLGYFGFEEESIVLADGEKVFEGINGLCKGVFLGTIGQDYNPVACVVMENGDVKMAGIFYALLHGGPDLSDALPGFKDVNGFESGGGGGWEDEETGETFYEYETIYALDERGGRTEIPYFTDHGRYIGRDDRYFYEISLTPDWKYHILCVSREDYSPHEGYSGSFSLKERTDDECVFEFRRHERMWAGEEDFEYDHTPVTGSFTASGQGTSYEIGLSGTDALPSGLRVQEEGQMENSMYDED